MDYWIITRTDAERYLKLNDERLSWTSNRYKAIHFGTKAEAQEVIDLYQGKFELLKLRYTVPEAK